jgi:hypothetical protein
VKIGRIVLWALVPITALLSVSSIWATFHYGPFGKPSQSAIRCAEVRELILDEEVAGKAQWNVYRQQVEEFKKLPANSPDRGVAVSQISLSVIDVLGHDLTIYQALQENIGCVKMDRREDVPGLVSETASTINYLNGSEQINGVFFNPDLGSWNVDFYSQYASALEFLKNTADASSV